MNPDIEDKEPGTGNPFDDDDATGKPVDGTVGGEGRSLVGGASVAINSRGGIGGRIIGRGAVDVVSTPGAINGCDVVLVT